MDSNKKQYPKGHFVGLWMGIGAAIFSGIVIPFSIITDNPGFMGLGPALGVAAGLAIGAGIEQKHEREGRIRPLTQKEIQTRKRLVWVGVLLLVVAVILAFGLFRTATA
jgi:hypothetical protein